MSRPSGWLPTEVAKRQRTIVFRAGPGTIFRVLMAIIGVLVTLSIAGMAIRFSLGMSKGLGAIALIDLNSETNFPTFISSA